MRDEVVVVRHEQKEVARIGRIERRKQREAFPFFIQIIAVVRLAVVQAKFTELRVVVDVDERRQCCWHDAVDELAGRGERCAVVVCRARNIGGLRDIEQFDSAIARGRGFQRIAAAAIAADDEKSVVVEREKLTLRRDPALAVGGDVERQRHDVLAHQLRTIAVGDVVDEHARVLPRLGRCATVLTGRALQQRRQMSAVRRQRETFKALIVLSARLRVRRLRRRRIGAGVVGGKTVLAVPLGDEGLGRPDRRDHPAIRRETVDVRPVFVADEKTVVVEPHDCFGVDAHRAGRGLRQRRKAIRRRPDAVDEGIEPGQWFAGGVRQQDGVGQSQFERQRAGLFRRPQRERELVEPCAII